MLKFKKNDLKTGHIVKLRNGQKAILTGDSFKDCILEHTAFIYEYNDDLIEEEYGLSAYDIFEVYDFKDEKGIKECLSIIYGNDNFLEDLLEEDYIKLIWKRENKEKREKREIDWTKVPPFTKVIVKDIFDTTGNTVKYRYFLKVEEVNDNNTIFFVTKCDKFTYTELEQEGASYIEIYDKKNIKEEWYK